MKVLENFEFYTFCFRHQFVWDPNQKLIWNPDESTLLVDSSLNSNFLQLLYGNSKIFEHESCFTLKMLQVWFWAKFRLSFGSKIIFKSRLVKFEFIQHFMWPYSIRILILHAKILTSPIKDIDAFYFAFHDEYEKLHYYPRSDVSHPKHKYTHIHTFI